MNLGFWRNGHAHKLDRLFQLWLRQLRKSYGTDLYDCFCVAQNSSAIIFNHETMPPKERSRFASSVNSILQEYHNLGLRMGVETLHELGRSGCSFKVTFKNLGRFNLPAPVIEPGVEKQLYSYGHTLGEQLREIIQRPSNRDPLGWKVVPVKDLPGVWLYVWFNNEAINDLSIGSMERYMAIIQNEFPNPQFRVARFVQLEQQIGILFDFDSQGEPA